MRNLMLSIALLCAANPASAGDTKKFPGEMCEVTDGNGTAIVNWGRVYNPSTTARVPLDCAIVSDLDNTNFATSWVKVIDDNPAFNEGVNCTLYVISHGTLNPAPAVLWFSTVSTNNAPRGSTFSSSYPQPLTFSGSYNNGAVDSKHMFCSLPAKTATGNKSYVSAYAIDE